MGSNPYISLFKPTRQGGRAIVMCPLVIDLMSLVVPVQLDQACLI